jgi:hypothetical protein
MVMALTLQASCGNPKEAITGDQLREEIQEWLSPPDPRTRYNIGREDHHEGTGKWLIEGEIFAEWKSSSNSLLWIHGKRMPPFL